MMTKTDRERALELALTELVKECDNIVYETLWPPYDTALFNAKQLLDGKLFPPVYLRLMEASRVKD